MMAHAPCLIYEGAPRVTIHFFDQERKAPRRRRRWWWWDLVRRTFGLWGCPGLLPGRVLNFMGLPPDTSREFKNVTD